MVLGGGKETVFKETLFQDRQETKVTHRLYLRDDNDEVDMLTAMVITMHFDDIIIDKPDKSYHQPFCFFYPS